METIRISTAWGLFRHKMEVEADSSHIVIFKRRVPFFGKMWQISDIPMEKVIFWGNNENAEKSRWLYVSEDGQYDTLPTSSVQESADDKDDWLFTSLIPKDEIISSEMGEVDEDLDADLYMNTSTTRLRLNQKELIKLYTLLQTSGSTKANVRISSGLIFKKYLAFTDKWLFHLNGKEVDSVPIKEMAFFVKNKKMLYCGYHRQISAKINRRKVFDEIRELCYSNSSRLSASGITYKAGILHPDYITLTDSAVVYTRKTLNKDEMAYVPYRRINLLMTTSGLFKKRISIFGEQNIILKHSLWHSKVAAIISKLIEHGVSPATGKSFSSAKLLPENWFGRGPRVVCLDDSIIYYPNRIKGSGNKLQSGMLHYTDISNVVWHKKPFALSGTIEIWGIPSNIRKDQNDCVVVMVIPQLWAFKYKWGIFGGKLRRILKDKTTAEFKRIRKAYEI